MTASNSVLGKINSFQSLGTVDGPGIRFVIFMQGCNLRCGCCHNPDTWALTSEKTYSPLEVADKVCKYRDYFGKDGGVTVSGGEPLLQAEFVKELFLELKKRNVNTCLDSSGSILNKEVLSLLDYTDRVLLDIKYTNNDDYVNYSGCKLDNVLEFLKVLNDKKIPTTIRQVIIPTINDSKENVIKLKELIKPFACIDKVELLPFKKLCKAKYDNLKITFPFGHLPTPTDSQMKELNNILNDKKD